MLDSRGQNVWLCAAKAEPAMNNSKQTQRRLKGGGGAESDEEARFERFSRILGGLRSPRRAAPTMISHFHLLLLLLLLPPLQGEAWRLGLRSDGVERKDKSGPAGFVLMANGCHYRLQIAMRSQRESRKI